MGLGGVMAGCLSASTHGRKEGDFVAGSQRRAPGGEFLVTRGDQRRPVGGELRVELAIAGKEIFDACAFGDVDAILRASYDLLEAAEEEYAYLHRAFPMILPCRERCGPL